jgi:subtilisin family serine protease
MSITNARVRSRPSGRAVVSLIAFAVALLALDVRPARSADPPPLKPVVGSPVGLGLLHTLGARASSVLAPSTGLIGALVELPPGQRAEDLGLDPVAPGIGRMRASASRIESFATAHPNLKLEMAPPLHPLMDRAGQWVLATTARATRHADGRGVMVGVADTGLDVTHPEMRDAKGGSRVAWLLDLSLSPGGQHPELEEKFGIKDDSGKVIAGRVFSKDDIDDLILKMENGFCLEKNGNLCAPADEVGHGTHVTGIAAATGANGGRYPGIAPAADVVFVRVTGASGGIENDNLLRAVEFMFDRAEEAKRPMVVNVSLGSDFGPHDGTFLWEKAVAAQVGPDHPGRVIVAAAGNSGSIVDTPIHQSVYVTPNTKMRVPIITSGADSGSVQVWATLRRGANLKVGLEGPDGEWIGPVASGHQSGKSTPDYNAGVIYGSSIPGSPIPEGSNGAVVVWQGTWPAGVYNVALEGSGMAELYLQSSGDAAIGGSHPAYFAHGVREGTVNLPATHPSIIGVGCTVNRAHWSSIAGVDVALKVPILDREGALPIGGAITPQPLATASHRDLLDGEVCWFSSAGPTAAGVPKPEIAAPGALVISALSRNATPGDPGSVFTSAGCPATAKGTTDKRCLQIDDTHGIAVGTSMSSPIVAGVVALLLQADPTLTQDKVLALLQAGAHRFRSAAPFEDQAGPGEVDAMGALDALDQMRDPTQYLPVADESWLTLSSDYVPADGSTPMTAIVELRTKDGAHRGDFFDTPRLEPFVLLDGKPVDPPPQMVRRGPGVWFFVWQPPAGHGGSSATFGATFDGASIVKPRTVPIATDRWSAVYASTAKGSGCSVSSGAPGFEWGALLFGLAAWARRRRHSSAKVTMKP